MGITESVLSTKSNNYYDKPLLKQKSNAAPPYFDERPVSVKQQFVDERKQKVPNEQKVPSEQKEQKVPNVVENVVKAEVLPNKSTYDILVDKLTLMNEENLKLQRKKKDEAQQWFDEIKDSYVDECRQALLNPCNWYSNANVMRFSYDLTVRSKYLEYSDQFNYFANDILNDNLIKYINEQIKNDNFVIDNGISDLKCSLQAWGGDKKRFNLNSQADSLCDEFKQQIEECKYNKIQEELKKEREKKLKREKDKEERERIEVLQKQKLYDDVKNNINENIEDIITTFKDLSKWKKPHISKCDSKCCYSLKAPSGAEDLRELYTSELERRVREEFPDPRFQLELNLYSNQYVFTLVFKN